MDLLNGLLAKAPELGVLAWLVWMFLRYISKRDGAQQALQKETNTILDKIASHSGKTDSLIKRNIDVLEKVEDKLERRAS